MKSISINGRKIGVDFPPYLVAEMSANHNGSLEKAKQVITEAHRCGADAVKLQTYTPDTMTLNCANEDFLIKGGLWDGLSLYELYQQAHTPFDWHKPLFDHAKKVGITCFSTPFDETAVDLLEDLNVPAYKIASFEAVDLPLIKYVASTRKPMIISTGMADEKEIEEAVETARENGCVDLILLHCISSYPTPLENYNVRTMSAISDRFNVIVGLSDHSLDNTVATTSVALGGCFVEKHFIFSRNEGGPDSSFSIEPEELRKLKQDLCNTWRCLGKKEIVRSQVEEPNKQFRRSIYWVQDANSGQVITQDLIKKVRPGFGLAPKYYDKLIGAKLRKNIHRGDAVTLEDVEW